MVHARLHRALSRLRRQAIIDAALIGATVGAAGFLVATLERRWIGSGVLPGADWQGDLLMGAALAVVSALGYGSWRFSRIPDIGGLARRADRQFGLDERLSTVIDLADAPPEGAVLRRALLADARRHLPRVIPETLAPFRLTPAAFVLPVLVVLGSAVVVLQPLSQIVPEVAQATETPIEDTEREAVAADVTRVADLMREQADLRDDPYMEAVARTLDAFAQRLTQDATLTRSEAVTTLSALSEEARMAGSTWRGEAGVRLPEMVAALADVLDEPAPPSDDAEPGEIPDSMAAGLKGDQMTAGAPTEAQPADGPREGLEAMLDEFAQSQGKPSSGSTTPEGLASPTVTGSHLDPVRSESEMAAQRAEEASQQAQLMGPSANAQAGESVLAGEGTDALGETAADPTAVTFETGDDFVLEANVTGEGRQMLRDLPPEAVLTPVSVFDLGQARARWTALPPAPSWRDHVTPAARVALQDYFLAMAAEVAR